MFQELNIRPSGAAGRWWTLVAGVVLFASISLPAGAQVLATYGFEDGTAQGWVSFNGASAPAASSAASRTGSFSLLTTTGDSGQGGPSIALTGGIALLPGATYSITGYLRLETGSGNANFTIRRNNADGSTNYDTIGTYQVPVDDAGWAQIGGSYTVPTTSTAWTLYAQMVGATSATPFYLDDVVIDMTAAPPAGNVIANYNFEDGTTGGWWPFGSPTLTNAMAPVPNPNGGVRSLMVTNRTASYMGPGLNLLGVSGLLPLATYQVSARILLVDALSDVTATLSTKLVNCANASGAYSSLATSAALSNTAWTEVQGTFSYSNFPGSPTELVLYIQSNSATASFYVDDVVISEVSPPPPDPSQQDNTGISTDFEDGQLGGWGSRSGSSTVSVVSDQAHGGTQSLLTTGRIANWDGPRIAVTNKMYNGSQYAISVWVRLEPTDSSSHVINMSVQVTDGGQTRYRSVTGYPGPTIVADGAWHEISVPTYSMGSYDPSTAATLYLQTVQSSGDDLVSFYIDDFQLSYIAPPTIQTNIPSMYQAFANFFPIGAALTSTELTGAHPDLLVKHYNSVVSGNDMKWDALEPTKGSFNWTNADTQVGFAQCHDMLVRGHVLLWAGGNQVPSWAWGDRTNSPENQALVTANIRDHVQNVVQHFGAKVYAWDVVNEMIDPAQPDCLVHGPFYDVLGPSYIDVTYQAAREFAPPGTKLFMNEYSTADPDRLACIVQVLQDLKGRGVPVDGFGHQMHNNINYPSVGAMVNSINTIANLNLGVEQHITEMDVSVYNAGDNTSDYGAGGGTVPEAVNAQQGYLYKQYFDAFVQLKGKLTSVTFWGLADDTTWLRSFPVTRLNTPLPFDAGLQAKPAFWGVTDPTQLPGWGLTFRVTAKTGPQNARVWTVTAQNPSAGVSYATQITGFSLQQTAGAACTPVITPPSAYPVALGDVPANGSASASFTIDFTGCPTLARFTLTMPWNAANGAYSNTLVSGNQFR